MLTLEDLDSLLSQNNVVVFTTYRRDGMPQQSLVTVGKIDNSLVFTTRSRNAKAFNLTRDPRCALMIISSDRRTFAVLDGIAEVSTPTNTDPEELRQILQGIYRAAAGKEHPDWAEYDKVMIEQKRIAISLKPTRIIGHNV